MPINHIIEMTQKELAVGYLLLQEYFRLPGISVTNQRTCLQESHLSKYSKNITDAHECWFFAIRMRRFLHYTTNQAAIDIKDVTIIRREITRFLKRFPTLAPPLKSLFLSNKAGINILIVGLLQIKEPMKTLCDWQKSAEILVEPVLFLCQWLEKKTVGSMLKPWLVFNSILEPKESHLDSININEVIRTSFSCTDNYPIVLKELYFIEYVTKELEVNLAIVNQNELARSLVAMTRKIINLKNLLGTPRLPFINSKSIFNLLVSIVDVENITFSNQEALFDTHDWPVLWMEFSELFLEETTFTKAQIVMFYMLFENLNFFSSNSIEHCYQIYFKFCNQLVNHELFTQAAMAAKKTLYLKSHKHNSDIPKEHEQYLALLIANFAIRNWIENDCEKIQLSSENQSIIEKRLYSQPLYTANIYSWSIAKSLAKTLINYHEDLQDENKKVLCKSYFKIFFNQLAPKEKKKYKHFLAKKAESSLSRVSLFKPERRINIDVPADLLDLMTQMKKASPKIKCFLTGGAIADLWLNQLPNDYDILCIGIGIEEFKKTIEHLGYECQMINLNLLKLSYESLNIDITFLSPSYQKKTLSQSLKKDYMQRDFSLCSLYIDLTQGPPIISFYKSEKHLLSKVIKTNVVPEDCFHQDPTRLFRLVKYQLKHPEFKTSTKLSQYLEQKTLFFGRLFLERIQQDFRFKGKNRYRLEELFERFELETLSHQQLFKQILISCFELNDNQWDKIFETLKNLPSHSNRYSNTLRFLALSYQINLFQHGKSNAYQLVYINDAERTLFRYLFEQYRDGHSSIYLGDQDLVEALTKQAQEFEEKKARLDKHSAVGVFESTLKP